MAKVKNLTIAVQSGTTDTLYATWSFASKYSKNLDHYTVKWYYATGDGKWFDGSESDEDRTVSTYSPPSHAKTVKVTVKPVSKTYKKNGKDTKYWSGTSVSQSYKMSRATPETPSAPTVTIEKYKLTAVLENIEDSNTKQIQFQVYKGNSAFASKHITVAIKRATFSCNVDAGGLYRVRCRAVNMKATNASELSEWSSFSSEVSTIPKTVDGVKCEVDTETSVKVTWDKESTADEYEIEYTTESKYFDTSSEVQTTTVESTTAYLTGLDSGYEYFIRVRAKNSQGESGWSDVVSVILGTTPTAPTTWSSTTTAMVGDEVNLYWTHNSEDGSDQKSAQIEITVNGSTNTVTFTEEDEEENGFYTYPLDLSSYTEGAEILWRVKTMGITGEYSEWSIQRTIKLYAPPTLTLTINEELNTFPYTIAATAGPSAQTAMKYHVLIKAVESYETEDATGSTIRVSAGSEVYSKIFVKQNNSFSVELTPSDISLENNQTYDVVVTVSMNTGLTAEATDQFTVSWSDESYEPDASVTIDEDLLCAYISPECTDEEGEYISDVTLSVYRREFDGTFTEIETDIANNGTVTVTDPHPSLDYARYRIVARSTTTGNMGFEDLPGEPVGEPSIVIQWDEDWTNFDYSEESEAETPAWTGSMIKLPYNVDVSEKYDIDTSLIEYIGRSHPVSYYGTQRGETASWSTEVPRTDKETIYALRRLAVWRGDVYVREPSGIGYHAQINVSMSQKHKELTVPVSFDITRVEGGK